ncbi:MAG: YggS family pyridoxal phosphate-dependent enzyme [Pseudomonadota bacterium]
MRCMDAQQIQHKLATVLQRVRLAEQKYQRISDTCELLAVSKTRPPEDLRAAYAAGQRAFGENYLQDALDKIEALADLDIEWHFIGPIQSNKTRPIAAHFHWVHSIDRIKIARRLSEQRSPELPPLNICLQVNVSGEASKSGLAPEALPELVNEIAGLPGLTLRGLMAIPAPSAEFNAQRQPFAQLRELLTACQLEAPAMTTLSMGMSADLEAAIAEGATLVRVGTDIFGPRNG